MKKKILISVVIIVFLLATATIIFIINKSKTEETPKEKEQIRIEFNSLFAEKQENYEIVALGYNINHEENGKSSITAQIPLLDGETETIQAINNEIDSIFVKKMYEVAENSQVYTIYNVEYAALEKDGIISLMIKCVLKSGSNPQRTIVKTYNYNIEEDRMISIDEILEKKQITKEDVNKELLIKIEEENEKNKIINEQGYNVYMRDKTSEIYNPENMTEFYVDKNNALYVIYAYGNQNNTSEMDVISF